MWCVKVKLDLIIEPFHNHWGKKGVTINSMLVSDYKNLYRSQINVITA